MCNPLLLATMFLTLDWQVTENIYVVLLITYSYCSFNRCCGCCCWVIKIRSKHKDNHILLTEFFWISNTHFYSQSATYRSVEWVCSFVEPKLSVSPLLRKYVFGYLLWIGQWTELVVLSFRFLVALVVLSLLLSLILAVKQKGGLIYL